MVLKECMIHKDLMTKIYHDKEKGEFLVLLYKGNLLEKQYYTKSLKEAEKQAKTFRLNFFQTK